MLLKVQRLQERSILNLHGDIKAIIIGDGSLMKTGAENIFQLQLKHAESQLPFLEWKKDILLDSGLVAEKYKTMKTYLSEVGGRRIVSQRMANCQNSYRWRIRVNHDFFIELYRRVYPGGKKNLDPYIFGELGARGMSIYHQDQGSLGLVPSGWFTSVRTYSPNFIWATCQPRIINQKIADVIKSVYGIEFHSHPEKNPDREILRLQIPSVKRFHDLISPYKAPGMDKKFISDVSCMSAELRRQFADDDIVRPHGKS